MKLRRIVAMYFSPTGNTEKLAMSMAKAIGDAAMDHDNAVPLLEIIDFTRSDAREKQYEFAEDDLLIIGLPVYAGRLPNKILPFVQENLKGNNTISLPFVCYGNRAFDDGLSELVYEQVNTGFRPAAAAAFATQHAFATTLSHGRPRQEDLDQAKAFALDLWSKIRTLETSDVLSKASNENSSEQIEIPAGRKKAGEIPSFAIPEVEGNMPPGPYYRPMRMDGEPAVFLKAKPLTDVEKCIGCGTCARVCSMGSIDAEDVTNVPGICIKCQACITHCPKGAKYFDHPDFLSHKEMLEANFTEEKANSFWYCKVR